VPMHELKGNFGCWCIEGVEQYINLSARALKTCLWDKTCAHCLLHDREENFGRNSLCSYLNLAFCRLAWAGYGPCKLKKQKEELK
jgi:hypothetical protein